MRNNIIDIIMDYSVNEGLNRILMEDEEYKEIQKEIDERMDQCGKFGFTKEQCLAVDRLVSAHAASGACYGRAAYRKGFHDCVSLLQEMGLIRAA